MPNKANYIILLIIEIKSKNDASAVIFFFLSFHALRKKTVATKQCLQIIVYTFIEMLCLLSENPSIVVIIISPH